LAHQHERLLEPRLHPRLCRSARIGLARDIVHRHPNRPGLDHLLQRHPVLVGRLQHDDAQRVVALEQQPDRRFEPRHIDRPGQVHMATDVVQRHARVQHLVEPDLALGGCERMDAEVGDTHTGCSGERTRKNRCRV
jgi:hypothetical protein